MMSTPAWFRWLIKLLGGRPMVREGYAFLDVVSQQPVYYWRDLLGRRWMATSAWSTFRVRRENDR
jgi:hypothetical protein